MGLAGTQATATASVDAEAELVPRVVHTRWAECPLPSPRRPQLVGQVVAVVQDAHPGHRRVAPEDHGHPARTADGARNGFEHRAYIEEPTLAEPEGRHCRLGIDALAGDRAWDVQGKFRLRIGPLNHDQFRDFMPEGREFRKLQDLVRMYVGPELDFELQVTLQAPEVPGARLATGEDDRHATRLGWNGWVLHAPSPVERKDAVFPMQDL